MAFSTDSNDTTAMLDRVSVQHVGPATDVAFSNDGRLMVTCGADATARLWHAASLSEADTSLRTGATDWIR